MPWSAAFPEDVRGVVELKGWKGPEDAVRSYMSLEKLRGVPESELLRLPKEGDQAGWDAFFGRLGRPAKPDEYELPEVQVSDGQVDLRPKLREIGHQLGLTKKQLKGFTEAMAQELGGVATARSADLVARQQAEHEELKREWGKEFDSNIRHAREIYGRLYKAVGYESAEQMSADFVKLENQIGTKRMLKMMAYLGRGLGEQGFVGDNDAPSGGFGMTPPAAMAKYEALHADPEFRKRLTSPDKTIRQLAIKEREALLQIAMGT